MILEKILTKQIAQDHVLKITVKELETRNISIKELHLTSKNKQEWFQVLSERLRGCPQNIIQEKIMELIDSNKLVPIINNDPENNLTKYHLNYLILDEYSLSR